jgi:hypothetical protein
MAEKKKPRRSARKATPKGTAKGRRPIRAGANGVTVFNSGLEVWLHDESSVPRLRESGAIAALTGGDETRLRELMSDGLLVGYGLQQDDALDVEVVVGKPLTKAELARAAWLEPQTAFLRLPTGRLRVDSNDTSRIGPEEPRDEGGAVPVPPGDYRVTLYRVDREALDREERTWDGAAEVVVLTPGGTTADAAKAILPFEPRRDLSWVGKYAIAGKTFTGLAWFHDARETYVVNVDRAAATRLGLVPGQVVRTTVPAAGLALVTTFATSWVEGGKLAPPAGVPLDEYGYGYLGAMADWGGKEALFCRRANAKTGLEARQMNVWLPATVEVLEVRSKAPERVRGEVILDAGKRVFWRGDLRARPYFRDEQFLTAVLMGRLDGLEWRTRLSLPRAVDLVDEALRPLGLEARGDVTFDAAFSGGGTRENTSRLYLGLADTLALLNTAEGTFTIWFVSELDGGSWAVTGTVREGAAQVLSQKKGLSARGAAGRLAALLDAHRAHVASLARSALPAPGSLEEAVARYERYLKAALD